MNDNRGTVTTAGTAKGTDDRGLYLIIVILIASRIFYIAFTHYISDDAYITYRYAANIADGKGFVFNPGEKVQGTSTPLYTLLLASAGIAGGTAIIPVFSLTVSICADVLSIIMLWGMLAGSSFSVRFLAGLVFALYPKIALIATSGMEASLAAALMFLCWYGVSSQRPGIYSIASLLLLLTRPDALLWVGLCTAWMLYKRSLTPSSVILIVLLYAPWMVFSALYFGSWIPHSMIAKEVSWHHLFPVFDPVRIFGAYLPVEFMRNSFSVLKFLVLAVLIAPVVIELAGLWKEKSALVLFPLFFLLYNLFFSFGRVLMADWYLLPGYTAYIVTAGSLAGRYLKQRSAMLQYGIITLSGVVLLIMFFTGAVRWQNNPGGLSIRQNKNLGIWLKQNASIYSQVLVEPIGAIGWESNMYVYDYIGMVSPKIVQYRKQFPTSDAWYAPFLKQERPEFIVQRNWELPENALFQGHGDGMFANDADKTWFEKTYSKVDWNPRAALDDSVYLVIYRRNAE